MSEYDEEIRYRRKDIEGGYLYNKSEIEYYKNVQSNDIIENCLMGDFNMVGSYVVNNSIVKELTSLNKVYSSSYSKTIFCESVKEFNGKYLQFSLKISNNFPKKGLVTAVLELLEDIEKVNGYFVNTNSVFIASQVFKDEKDVNTKVFKAFNIFSTRDPKDDVGDGGDGNARIENDYEVKNILDRMKYLSQLKILSKGQLSKFEKVFYEKRMKILIKSGIATSIIEDFNREIFHIRGRFINIKDINYYKHLNQILDGILDRHSALIRDNNQLNRGLKTLQDGFSDSCKKVLEAITEISLRATNEKFRTLAENQAQKQRDNQNKILQDTDVKSRTEIKKAEVKEDIKAKAFSLSGSGIKSEKPAPEHREKSQEKGIQIDSKIDDLSKMLNELKSEFGQKEENLGKEVKIIKEDSAPKVSENIFQKQLNESNESKQMANENKDTPIHF